MQRPASSHRKSFLASFTLVELLTVIAIIAILAALTLAAASAFMGKAARSRASSEIAAMSTALEGYKTDNGAYPTSSGLLTNTYASSDPSTLGGLYQSSSQVIYEALSGQINYLDTPVAGVRVYMTFKRNQLGNTSTPAGTSIAANTSTYVQDPWGYSYGYSTGSGGGGATPLQRQRLFRPLDDWRKHRRNLRS